jgi:eIF3 subunit 6 N terminal domain
VNYLSNNRHAQITNEPWQIASNGGHCYGVKPTCILVAVLDALGLDKKKLSAAYRLTRYTMADHDLSKTIIAYLDRHLAFPLLAHLTEISIFPIEEVQAAQYELAKGTNMVDYAVNLFQELNPDKEIPAGEERTGLSSGNILLVL